MFNPVVSYVPGKSHHVADALSRHPKFHFMSEGEDCIAGVYEQRCCHATSHRYARDDPKMAPLFAAARNANYRKVVEAVHLGGKYADLPADNPGREFEEVWDEIAIIDEQVDPLLVVDDRKVVVPLPAQEEVLRFLHLPHIGVTKMRETACTIYYWP